MAGVYVHRVSSVQEGLSTTPRSSQKFQQVASRSQQPQTKNPCPMTSFHCRQRGALVACHSPHHRIRHIGATPKQQKKPRSALHVTSCMGRMHRTSGQNRASTRRLQERRRGRGGLAACVADPLLGQDRQGALLLWGQQRCMALLIAAASMLLLRSIMHHR